MSGNAETLTDITPPVALAGDELPVNEVFSTIQGEGLLAGTPATFVRLQGCAVGCPWCDTRFTWDLNQTRRISPRDMLFKEESGSDAWAAMTVPLVVVAVAARRPRHVVITGGEPCEHDLTALTEALHGIGKSTQIETSGTRAIRCAPGTHVTLSPKIGMPGGYEVRDDAIARADEIKMPVGKMDDVIRLLALLSREQHRPGTPVLLQPISRSARAMELCVQNATANNWRVSVQLHALTGWR